MYATATTVLAVLAGVLGSVQAPNANAYAERFVRSIEEELLDRMIPLGERHFRRALTERNHQGIGNQLIEAASPRRDGKVRGCPRLGGLLNHYERAA